MKLTTHLHLVPRSKNAWSYTYTPLVRLHGVVFRLKGDRDKFTFTFKRNEVVGLWGRLHE